MQQALRSSKERMSGHSASRRAPRDGSPVAAKTGPSELRARASSHVLLSSIHTHSSHGKFPQGPWPRGQVDNQMMAVGVG